MEHTTTVTEESKDWVITQSMSDDSIRQYIKDLCNDPYMTIKNPDGNSRKKLYSVEQLCDAFRLGIRAMSDTETGRRIMRERYKHSIKSYSVLREMNVGDKHIFPYELWNTVRTAASTLKKQYGSVFKVIKLGRTNEIGDIEVKRLS